MSATMAPPVNASSVSATDRSKRFDAPMASDLARIRNEYVEMPGLVLTLPQAARLWSLSESRSQLLLSLLVEAGFLICDKKTVYRRRLDRSEKSGLQDRKSTRLNSSH